MATYRHSNDDLSYLLPNFHHLMSVMIETEMCDFLLLTSELFAFDSFPFLGLYSNVQNRED